MQGWGSEQGPGGSVLLRTGALMSLASLGTAGLVVCGVLAVGGPSGGTFPGAFPTGAPSVTDDPAGPPPAHAAPAGLGTSEQPDAASPARPVLLPGPAARDGSRSSVDRADGGTALSGTTSAAARTPSDLDSVVHPSRRQLVVAPSVAPPLPPAASAVPQRPMSAVRVKPVPPAPAATAPSSPLVAASTAPELAAVAPPAHRTGRVTPPARRVVDARAARPKAAQPAAPASRTAPQSAPQVEDQAARPDDRHADHPKGGPAGQDEGDRPEH